MSRLTGKEVYSLMEAYQAVYAPQELTEEQVWEGVENWVQSLLEEGYDLSDYTWEEMYESYLSEGPYDAANVKSAQQAAQDGQVKRDAAAAALKAQTRSQDVADYRKAMLPPPVKTFQNTAGYGRYQDPKTQNQNQSKYKSTSDGKMYANYNDALAANRSRNALKPTIASLPPNAAVKGDGPKGNEVGSNLSPFKPPTPTQPPARPDNSSGKVLTPTAPKPAVKTITPEKPMGGDPMDQWTRANPTLAAKVKQGQSGYNTIRTRLDADNDRQENYDAYDLVLSHLINEGYADTQEAALAIMGNMSEDWKQSIVETRRDPRGRPASGPMNVYANPRRKPSQAHLDAIAAVEADNKKKTPEQREKELADYRERQMNNK